MLPMLLVGGAQPRCLSQACWLLLFSFVHLQHFCDVQSFHGRIGIVENKSFAGFYRQHLQLADENLVGIPAI
mgnify:CR=1 FL=1